MAHRTFGAVRTGVQREAITFDFGIYGEESFTVVPDPTLGDLFELHDAPEPTPTNELESARLLARFICRMLPVEERSRFDETLKRIPSSESHIIVDCAAYITGQVAGFPTTPSPSSSAGRRSTGPSSKRASAGRSRSK